MKNTVAFLIILCMLVLALVACTENRPSQETTGETATLDQTTEAVTDTTETTEEVTDVVTREDYVDLSFDVPTPEGRQETVVSVRAEGDTQLTQTGELLVFDGKSGLFTISAGAFGGHKCFQCDTCGFLEDGSGYLISTHNEGNSSILITLSQPIPLAKVTGMTVTYRTTKNAATSEIRVFDDDATQSTAMLNSCPSLAGAVDQSRTVDLGLELISELADSNGNLSAFLIVFRNKDNCDLILESLSIVGSGEQYLQVDDVSGNCFSAGDAIYDIANQIASRFDVAEVQADITVEVKSYTPNTTQATGSVDYTATAVLANGTTITTAYKAKIPAVSGVWLGATRGDFGSAHDAKDQWKDWFDPSGMVLLKSNVLSCAEGVDYMEYALILADGTYDDSEVVWCAPQVLEMNQRGVEVLFANAYLDYADKLVAGERYRFLVRGVSNCQNYILHLDIPFTYQPLSSTAEYALAQAMESIKGTVLHLTSDASDKVEVLKQRLNEAVGNPDVVIDVTLWGEGLNSVTISVDLIYKAAINQARLPSYSLNGETFTTVYNFKGTSFAIKNLTLSYEVFDGEILLQSPYDGAQNVPIASPYIRKVFTSPMDRLREPSFGYLMGENCNPVPVSLTWNDRSGVDGKTYTVTISEHSDFSDAKALTTSQTKIDVEGLKTNATYYWKVSDGQQQSQTFVFTTESPMAYFMVVDGVSNFRDIGGYVTQDGLRVKQGLAFRSAALDSITSEGKQTMIDTLGIKTELDLRGGGAAVFGSEVSRQVIAMQWFEHIFKPQNYEVVRTTIAAFAVEENYPLNFHCSVGRDRTGTTSFLILGLLGVEEEILVRDYFCSFFSDAASISANDIALHVPNIEGLVKGIKKYGAADATLQEHIEQYLLTIGITLEEMESIRYILLDGYDGTTSGSAGQYPAWDVAKDMVVHQSVDALIPYVGESGGQSIFAPNQFDSWDLMADLTGSMADALCYQGWIGIKGQVGQLGYRVDSETPIYHDGWLTTAQQSIIDTAQGMGADTAVAMQLTIDLADLEGVHIIRVLYKNADGAEVTLCRFAVKLPTKYDKQPSEPIRLVNGCVDFETISVASEAQPYDINSKAIKVRSHDTVLKLGIVDLSKYTKVIITYGSDHRANLGNAGSFYALTKDATPVTHTTGDNVIASGKMENASGVSSDAWKGDRSTVIDLSSIEYDGVLYLSIFMGDGNGVDIFSIEFVEEES